MDILKNPQSMQFVIMIGFVFVFYFMLIRPQRQQQKKRQDMLNALKVGDKVITTGGIYGEITEIKDKSLRVKIAQGVVLRMDRSGIQDKTTKTSDD
ncbi:MAG TPA: preprotein translocase subunit YajC [bacterium]|nr:preprotein translocase subunit YajC [bacterium]